MQPVVQSTSELPKGPLQLWIYPGTQCRGSVYTDDGETLNYTRGDFSRTDFACTVSSEAIDVTIARSEGPFKPWWDSIQVHVVGVVEPQRVTALDQPAPGDDAVAQPRRIAPGAYRPVSVATRRQTDALARPDARPAHLPTVTGARRRGPGPDRGTERQPHPYRVRGRPVAGTRGALGAGLGLLLADRLSAEQRRAVGWTLFLVGALSTIPLAFEVLGSGRLAATT